MHEEVFTALLGLPFAALSLDFSSASAYPLMLEAHGYVIPPLIPYKKKNTQNCRAKDAITP